jgi:hypothetical protein
MTKEEEDYEHRLRQRLDILRKEFEAGNIKIASDLTVIESLKAVRYGADGKIDLTTVDGSVRALALATEGMKYRKDTKKVISLQDLQQGYFENVEAISGNLYRQMGGDTPFQVASAIARDPEGVRIFHKSIPPTLEWVQELWAEAYDVAHIHVEDIQGLKGVFGGETFPQGNKNIVSSTGLYVDTNVLPDPFLRSRFILEGPDEAAAVRAFITNGLSLLKYKQAALASLDIPLVTIVPDLIYLDENIRNQIFALAQDDTVSHLSAMFGIPFENFDAASGFVKALESASDVTKHLDRSELLLLDVDDVGPIEARINSYIKTFIQPYGFEMNAGDAVIASTVGRMRQANDLLFRSTRLRGSPLIDAPTSWRYFGWKLSYGDSGRNQEALTHLHMTKALQSAAAGEMQWLGNVPIEALVEIRKQDVLPELRMILSGGVRELIERRPDNFFRTGDQVVENIQNAFDEHRRKLSALTGKKWRCGGVELASCIVKGAVQIASACGVPVVSLIGAALDQAVDVPKIKDVPKRIRSLRDESRELNGSAVGMLFQLSKRS